MEDIIFYSNKCQHCIKLLDEISKCELSQYFKMYCIDGNMTEIRKYIKTVPTIIINNLSKPLIGYEAFRLIESFKEMKNKNKFCTDNGLMFKNIIEQINISGLNNTNMDYVDIDGNLHNKKTNLLSCNKQIDLTPIHIKKKLEKEKLDIVISSELSERKIQESEASKQNHKYIQVALYGKK